MKILLLIFMILFFSCSEKPPLLTSSQESEFYQWVELKHPDANKYYLLKLDGEYFLYYKSKGFVLTKIEVEF